MQISTQYPQVFHGIVNYNYSLININTVELSRVVGGEKIEYDYLRSVTLQCHWNSFNLNLCWTLPSQQITSLAQYIGDALSKEKLMKCVDS